jgi:GNAT superfamily N-acetyltransferase
MRIGPDYRAEHVLADGTRVVVRTIRPEDAETLRAAFARLSPATRYSRFFGGVSTLSDETLRYLTNVDGVSHVALVAGVESPDLKTERGLGVARFIRLPGEPDVAEAAVTVVDDMQHRGVGRILLTTLAEAARERGVHHFRAEVLASNEPIRKILHEVGAVVQREDQESVVFDVSLDPPGVEPERTNPLTRLLREAAASMAGIIRSRLGPPSA